MLRRFCGFSPPVAAAITSSSLRFQADNAAAATTTGGGAATKKPPFLYTDLGLNDSNWQALYAGFSDKHKKRSDSFIPAMSIFHQCRYTVGVYRQLTRQLRQGRLERWLPAACLIEGTNQASTSRLIIATAFDEYRQTSTNTAATKTGSKQQQQQQKQRLAPLEVLRQKEQLQLARRLAVEHFNWSYYWRSLTFEEETGGSKAQASFAQLAEPHSSFFLSSSSSSGGGKKSSKSKGSQEEEEQQQEQDTEKLISQIKASLREHALQGGATTLGGSWTWLVWNPMSGTDFSTSNRYGVAGGGVSAMTDKGSGNQSSKKQQDGAEAAEAKESSNDSDAVTSEPTTTFTIKVGGRIEVINTPFDVCPLDYGLFPLLCINMTERSFLAPPTEWATVPVGEVAYHNNSASEKQQQQQKPPAWSRAARVADTLVTRTATLPTPGFQAFETIEKQRSRFVDGLLNNGHVNWHFAAHQLRRAIDWNESDVREQQLRAQAQAAWDAAESRLRRVLERRVEDEEGDVVVDVDGPSQKEAEQAEKQQQQQQDLTATLADEEAAAAVEQEAATEGTPEEDAAPEPEKSREVISSVAEDGSQVLEYPDGMKEYRYPDGRKTKTFADGTTEWYGAPSDSADAVKLTRQKADGSMEYFYNSGQVLQDTPLPDGKGWKRVVRYPDGTHTEEILPAS